jgi:gamma-glutamyl-gamma-aminobutyrate hydrolase PuuD
MDNSIEAFKHLKFKIYGIMWHPERNKKIKYFDIKYFKKFR